MILGLWVDGWGRTGLLNSLRLEAESKTGRLITDELLNAPSVLLNNEFGELKALYSSYSVLRSVCSQRQSQGSSADRCDVF